MPTIVLGQEEVDCFSAWVSIEAGLPECDDPTTEIKVRIRDYNGLYVTILNFIDKLWQITA